MDQVDNLVNSSQEYSLKGRKAVLTGGSSGIGFEILKKLSQELETLICLDQKPPPPFDDRPYSKIEFISLDFSKPQDFFSLARDVEQKWGVPQILICNAGRGIQTELIKGNPEQWEEIFQINLLSVLRLLRSFLPVMLKLNFVDVVFVSSVSANNFYRGGGIYSATKAGLEVIAETLRLELQPQVRVLTIAPGVVETPFFANIIDGNQTPESIGWGALHPGDVADAILYALKRPSTVALNKIVIRPAAQPM